MIKAGLVDIVVSDGTLAEIKSFRSIEIRQISKTHIRDIGDAALIAWPAIDTARRGGVAGLILGPVETVQIRDLLNDIIAQWETDNA